MGDGEEGNVRIDIIDGRILEPEIGEPLEMGVDLVEGCPCKRARRGAGDLRSRVVNEEANQLATGITGGPDNRNFHTHISGCKNLMLFNQLSRGSGMF